MKKNIYVFIVFLYLVFTCNNIYAEDASISSPSNNPGNGTAGGTGTAGTGTNWYTSTKQIRVRVFDKHNNLKKSGYYLLANNSCKYNQNSGILCETPGYDYSSVNNSENVTCRQATINIGCIKSSNIEKIFEQIGRQWYSSGDILKDYLENNDFENLKLLLTSLEYHETNYRNGDFIIIEPVTLVKCAGKFYFGTSTALMMRNVSYRGYSDNACAASDNNYGTQESPVVGYTFQNLFKMMSIAIQQKGLDKYPGNNQYSGMGYFKYDISEIFNLPLDGLSCLSGNITNSTFSFENSLYYDEKVYDEYGNVVAYCDNSLEINNNLGVSTFYGSSGQLLIRKDDNLYTIYKENLIKKVVNSNSGIATAISKKICYVLKGNTISYASNTAPYSVEMYLANKKLTFQTEENDPIITYGDENDEYDIYEYQTNYNFDLGEIYIEKVSGKVVDKEVQGETETVFGLASKFNDTEGSIEFKVIYNGEDYISNDCKYSLEQKIIEPKGGKLNLEFRIIDTKKPFNRKTMSNWSDGKDNSKNNDVVQEYIKNAINSYGLDKDGNRVSSAKYKITLTPSDIKIIREYNMDNPYDNYEVYCDDNKCTNAFVYDLKKGTLNKYESNKNVKFYGVLSHRLEV